jgi:hypothetical protein
MNRLPPVVDPVVSPTQTAFLKNRYIMEGVLILHETLNSLHIKKWSGIMFKVDFKKAYDKIKWPFVYHMLKLKGFSDTWCDLVMKTITGGKVGIKVNNKIGPYFVTHQGLRQGVPSFPLAL